MSEFTHIILRLESGDPQAAEQLLPLVYRELRKLAAAKLAQEKPGQTLFETGKTQESHDLFKQSLAIYESLMADYPVRTDFRQEFALFLSNRAMLLFQSQKFKDAETACSRAVEIQEAIVRKSPSVLDNYAHIGKSLVSLGLIREAAGDLDWANTAFRQGITYLKSALEKKPDHPFFQQLEKTARESLAKCCNNRAYRLAAHPLDKVRNGESAVAIATEACELTEWKSWEYLDTLAAAYAEKGDFAQAMKWQQQAMKQLPLLTARKLPNKQASTQAARTLRLNV